MRAKLVPNVTTPRDASYLTARSRAEGTAGPAAGGKSMKHRFDTVDNGDTHGASQFAAYLLLRNDKLSFALRYGHCRYVANNVNAPCLIWLSSFPRRFGGL